MGDQNIQVEENGIIKISDEVVSIIAGMTAAEVSGVVAMSSGIAGGIAEILGAKKNLSKGIKVEIRENDVSIDMHVIIAYGERIPEVAWELQEKTKKAIESMTGLNVLKINVFVDGIVVPEEKQQESVQLDLELDDTDI